LFAEKNTSGIFQPELNSDELAIRKIERLFEKYFKPFAEMASLTSVVFQKKYSETKKN
jgi:hypothetical protein